MQKFDAGIIGMGGMGKTHVEAAVKSPYVDKIYGFDPDPEICRERAKEFGVIPVSFEELLARPEIKFVSIASPNDFHVKQAAQALEAGKAVLCEKPMGRTLEEAEYLVNVQKKTNGFLQIGFELHYSQMYKQVKDWINAGLLGDVVNVQCRYYCCEFHKKNNWRSNSTGSFLIGEKLSHYLDLERWFFDVPVKSVYSLSAPKVVEYFHHRDNHQIMTKFEDGKVGVLNFIMYIAETHHEDPLRETLAKQSEDGHFLQYHICGTKGAVETDVFKRRIRRWEFSDGAESLESKIVETITFEKEHDQEYFHNVEGQNMRVMELVAKGLPPEVPACDALETMRLCAAAEYSEDTGKLIEMADFKH